MQSEATDKPVLGQPLQQTKNRGLVALIGESRRTGELRKRHRPGFFKQRADQLFERLGSAEACFPAAVDGLLDDWIHEGSAEK